MVVVDVVQIDREASDDLSDARIPSRVENSRHNVAHAGGIRLGLRLLAEHGSVEDDISDVFDVVVLHLNNMLASKDGDADRLGSLIRWIVNAFDTRNDPNEIHVIKVFAHELTDDT